MRISDWSSECALPISFLGPDAALAGPHEDSQPTPSRCISRHVHRDAGQPALEFQPDNRQLWLLERTDDRGLSRKPSRRSKHANRPPALRNPLAATPAPDALSLLPETDRRSSGGEERRGGKKGET